MAKASNCIPTSIALLQDVGDAVEEMAAQLSIANASNKKAEELQRRTYRDGEELGGCVLIPKKGVSLDRGKYLVHAEDTGRPHCLALQVYDGEKCLVLDGDFRGTAKVEAIRQMCHQAVDEATVVFF